MARTKQITQYKFFTTYVISWPTGEKFRVTFTPIGHMVGFNAGEDPKDALLMTKREAREVWVAMNTSGAEVVEEPFTR